MSEDPEDRRKALTRSRLYEGLVELSLGAGFESVTVRDLTKRADVNRATFYRHYRDKYDMVAEIFHWTGQGETHSPESSCLVTSFHQIFDHFATHERLFLVLTGRRGSSWFKAWLGTYWSDVTRALLGPVIIESQGPEEREVCLLASAHVLEVTVSWWLAARRPWSSEYLAQWFLAFVGGGLRSTSIPYK